MGPDLSWAPARIDRRHGEYITIELPAPQGEQNTWTMPEEELEAMLIRDNGETRSQSRLFPDGS